MPTDTAKIPRSLISVRISFDSFSSSTMRASTIAPTMADQAAIAARRFA
jgi:hypothetical protein